jgi:lysophospholipase L1-like esterase
MFNSFPTVFQSANRSTYWSSDKLHLTATGYQLIANAIDAKIVELVVAE